MKFLWRVLVPVLVLAVGAAGAVALIKTKPKPKSVASVEKAWIVTVETASPATTAPTLVLYGRVESPRVAVLTSAIEADVRTVEVAEGETVREGQTLVLLDDREGVLLLRQRTAEVAEVKAQIEIENQRYQTDLSSLELEKRLAELSARAVRRARDLVNKKVGSKAQLDQSRQDEVRQLMALEAQKLAIQGYSSRIDQLRARLARAEALQDLAALDVERTRIRAPFAGRITEVGVSPGNRARTGGRLLSLFDNSAVEIRAQIPTRYLPALRRNLERGNLLEASAIVDARPLAARLDRLGGQVESGSGGVDGLFRVTAGGESLQLGRTVELEVRMPAREGVVAVPPEAIYGTDRIFTLAGERMQSVVVERLGEVRLDDGATRLLVRSPELGAGVKFVTTQLPNAVDGLKVRAFEPGRAR